jgi:ABC-2 type transport system permease protein
MQRLTRRHLAAPRETGAATPAMELVRPKPWRKYLTAFRISITVQLAYPGELWMRTVFLVLIMFIFSSLWHTTYAEMGRSTLGGFSLTQMLWYLALTESLILSRPRDSFRVDEEVRTGDLAYALARPYNFLLYRYAQVLGERLVRLGVNLTAAVPLALAFSRGVGVSLPGLVPGLAAVLTAISIDYLLVMALCLLAFWVEDTASFLFVYDRLLMILGGMLLPLSLFPGPLEAAARALPFSAIINGPAQTFVGFDGSEFVGLMARQGAALALAVLLACLMFRLGTRRIQANGG